MTRLLHIVYESGALRVYQQCAGDGHLVPRFYVEDPSGAGRVMFTLGVIPRSIGVIVADRTSLVLTVIGDVLVVPARVTHETWERLSARVARWLPARRRRVYGTVIVNDDDTGGLTLDPVRPIMSS